MRYKPKRRGVLRKYSAQCATTMARHYRATSFATRQDLAAFCRAVTQGRTPREALSIGDNGMGAWGDATWKTSGVPICALPRAVAGHNTRIKVTLSVGHRQPFVCFVRDVAPAGVIDLNPAALIAAGLDADTDLNDENARWELEQCH